MKALIITLLLLNSTLLSLSYPTKPKAPKIGTSGVRGYILCSIPKKYDHVSIFLNKHWNAAKAIENECGVPMAISLAIWGLESKYGQKPVKRNNYGSIKKNHVYVTYDTVSEFYTDFTKIFKQDCYKEMNPQTVKQWAISLQRVNCTYAMSKKYYSNIMWIVQEFNLDLIPLKNETE